jgi:3-hydroxyisobutyrate dehydrogenase
MTNIGFLGTGLMGQPMVLRLLEANITVTAYNRTASKLEPLQAAGARIVDSPEAVLEAADCSLLMLSDRAAIEELLLSRQSLSNLENHTIIQMGTIAPIESQLIRDALVNAGGEYLEAPVLGSIPQVKTGELIVMVGSTPEQFDRYTPLLQHFSSTPMYVGEVGTAAAMKLALNQLIAGLTATFAISLGFVARQGVDIEQFMSVVRQSALYAPTFDKKLSRMRDGNYDNPNFPTKHLLKDTNLFLEQARVLGLNTSSLEGIKHLIQQAIALGLADSDYSAIYSAIEGEN